MMVAHSCFEFESGFDVGWRQFSTLACRTFALDHSEMPHCNCDIFCCCDQQIFKSISGVENLVTGGTNKIVRHGNIDLRGGALQASEQGRCFNFFYCSLSRHRQNDNNNGEIWILSPLLPHTTTKFDCNSWQPQTGANAHNVNYNTWNHQWLKR